MKTITCLLWLSAVVFSFQSSFAQSQIFGKVIDDAGQPLAFASVLLLQDQDSSLIKGSITDDEGRFKIENIDFGKYIIGASSIGYETIYSTPIEITSTNQQINVKTLSIGTSVADLSEVQVIAKKPLFEQKIDRLIVNVENSITSAGSTALEVLERSPGVIVNRQSNGLSLSGKEGVVVMINGKINYMPIDAVVQMLAGMSADNIEKIELITTPPANFDAEGDAGFINIVLKKNTDYGTNGSYTFSAGYGKGPVSAASLNFNHRTEKLSLYGSYSFLYENQKQFFYNFRRVSLPTKIIETDTPTDRDPIQRNHNARFGLDYQLSEKTVFGALLSAYDNKWSMDAVNDIKISVNGQPDTLLTLLNDEINQWKNLGGNLNLQHTFDQGDQLSIDADYLFYHDNNPNNYDNTYTYLETNTTFNEDVKSTKKTPIKIGVGKLDYRRNFGEQIKLESGLKGTISRFNNDIGVQRLVQDQWISDPNFTAEYDLKEDIAAAYTALDIALDEQTTIKAGLRYEYTWSNLSSVETPNIVDRKYGQLFPSLFVSRKFNDNNTVNFAYSRRITRPTFNDIAPFIIFLDPNTFFSGNERLQPSTTNAIKMDYRFKTVLFSLQYSQEDSAIARWQVRVIPETNQQFISSTNLKNRKTATLVLGFPWEVTDWWQMQNNMMGLWQQVNTFYEGEPLQFEQQNMRFSSTQTFKLPSDFSVELSGFYQTKSLFGTAIIKATGMLNFGIQKQFKEGKGRLRVSVDDVFNSFGWNSSVNLPEQNLVTTTNYDFSQRTYKVTYARNFGNNKLKGARNRTTGSEEERQRVN